MKLFITVRRENRKALKIIKKHCKDNYLNLSGIVSELLIAEFFKRGILKDQDINKRGSRMTTEGWFKEKVSLNEKYN